jgi:predicted ATP-grasp superfamily ATP-dependent carboligase
MKSKYTIKNLATLRKYCAQIENPVIAVGARPYSITFGVHSFFKKFELLACKGSTQEVPLLEEKLKITYLPGDKKEYRNLKTYKNYSDTKRPEDLFLNKKIIAYLKSFKSKPLLLFFRKSAELEKSLKNKPFIQVGSNFDMFQKYENKVNFQKLLDQLNIPSPRHVLISANDLNYKKLTSLVGRQFVIQLSGSALGAGTFFILKKSDFDKTLRNPLFQEAKLDKAKLKIASYIQRESSPSMTICVTNSGILCTGLQKQIIDAKEVLAAGRRSGIYCGHDWSNSHFKPGIEAQALAIAKKIGSFFKKHENFRGIFGIDFVLEKSTHKLYPIEANVRLLGSFPILSMVQESAGQPVIQALQIIESLNRNDYKLDIEKLNALMAQPKKGAHLNIYSKIRGLSYVSKNIRPGIYRVNIANKKVIFLRNGFLFEDLRQDDEVLLTAGVPYRGRVYKEHGNICKLVTRNGFLADSDKLNPFAKIMVAYVYKNLGIRRIK